MKAARFGGVKVGSCSNEHQIFEEESFACLVPRMTPRPREPLLKRKTYSGLRARVRRLNFEFIQEVKFPSERPN